MRNEIGTGIVVAGIAFVALMGSGCGAKPTQVVAPERPSVKTSKQESSQPASQSMNSENAVARKPDIWKPVADSRQMLNGTNWTCVLKDFAYDMGPMGYFAGPDGTVDRNAGRPADPNDPGKASGLLLTSLGGHTFTARITKADFLYANDAKRDPIQMCPVMIGGDIVIPNTFGRSERVAESPAPKNPVSASNSLNGSKGASWSIEGSIDTNKPVLVSNRSIKEGEATVFLAENTNQVSARYADQSFTVAIVSPDYAVITCDESKTERLVLSLSKHRLPEGPRWELSDSWRCTGTRLHVGDRTVERRGDGWYENGQLVSQ